MVGTSKQTTTRAAAILAGALSICTLAGPAFAAVIVTPDPGGYATDLQFRGVDGSPKRPSRWSDPFGDGSIATRRVKERITYRADLADDDWRLGVTAINWGRGRTLPPGYAAFRISVYLNGRYFNDLFVDASDAQWVTGWLDLGPRKGPTSVTLRWRNSAKRTRRHDANLAIGAVQFARPRVPESGTLTLLVFGLLCHLGAARRFLSTAASRSVGS